MRAFCPLICSGRRCVISAELIMRRWTLSRRKLTPKRGTHFVQCVWLLGSTVQCADYAKRRRRHVLWRHMTTRRPIASTGTSGQLRHRKRHRWRCRAWVGFDITLTSPYSNSCNSSPWRLTVLDRLPSAVCRQTVYDRVSADLLVSINHPMTVGW